MLHIDDVALLAGDHRRDGGKRPRAVRHLDVEPDQASGSSKSTHQHRREDPRVDVAATRDQCHVPAPKQTAVLQHRGKRRGPGALDHRLLDLDEERCRLFDALLGDGQKIVDESAHDLAGQLSGLGHRNALGDRGPVARRRSATEHVEHARIPRALHTNDTYLGTHRLHGHCYARDQSPAADGHDDRVDHRRCRQDLEGDRPLAGDDQAVVESRNQYRSGPCRHGLGLCQCGLVAVALQHDVGAMEGRVGDLGEGRAGRHHNRGGDAEQLRMIGNALRMIACRGGDDTVPTLLRQEMGEEVSRPSLLERTRELQVLELHPQIGARDLRERPCRRGRGHDHRARDGVGGRLDVGQGHGKRHGLIVA